MQNMKVYNTFDFVARLSMPKETEKFKVYTKTKSDSGWVNEELKLNAKISDSSELISIKDGYFDKANYELKKQGVGKKKDDGSFEKGADVKFAWKSRTNQAIIDKIANYQKFTLDLSNNKERYDLNKTIEKLSDDAVTDEAIEQAKNTYEIIKDKEDVKEIIEILKTEYDRLLSLKKEYLSRIDMIPDLKKLINTPEGTNTIFHITGDYEFSEWNGKVYQRFSVRRIEKATEEQSKKLKLKGTLDVYFKSDSLDSSAFDMTKKYILNVFTKTYDSQLKKDIYVPVQLIADASKLDLTKEKHQKLINGIIKPFNFDNKDENIIYQLPFNVKFANGSEKIELTYDDLTDVVKEYVDDGIMTLEEAIIELGGDKFGDRVNEIRLLKPVVKDFLTGAVETELTLEDLIIERQTNDSDNKETTSEINDTNSDEEDDEELL